MVLIQDPPFSGKKKATEYVLTQRLIQGMDLKFPMITLSEGESYSLKMSVYLFWESKGKYLFFFNSKVKEFVIFPARDKNNNGKLFKLMFKRGKESQQMINFSAGKMSLQSKDFKIPFLMWFINRFPDLFALRRGVYMFFQWCVFWEVEIISAKPIVQWFVSNMALLEMSVLDEY